MIQNLLPPQPRTRPAHAPHTPRARPTHAPRMPSCVTFVRGAAHLPALRLGAAQLTYLRHVWALTFPKLRHHFLIKISLDVEKKFKDASLGRPFGPPLRRFR